MLFAVEDDQGASIRCHLVPDAGGAQPSLRISGHGRELAVVHANELRPELLASGRHATGLCGFHLDAAAVPGLADCADLELREAESGLLVYRRPGSDHLADTKVLRLETHLLPLRRFDEAFSGRFQSWYEGIERLGLETTTHLFRIPRCTSLYLSGRLRFPAIQPLVAGFRLMIVLRDPFHELAERLLVLRNLPDGGSAVLGPRDLAIFQGAIEFVHEAEALDARFCRNFTKWAPPDVLRTLSNPVTRQLTVADDAEMPRGAVAAALQALAGFDVVGVRDDGEAFRQAVGELLGRAPPPLREYSRVVELGERLRAHGRADTILDRDLELYDGVKQAFASVGGEEPPEPAAIPADAAAEVAGTGRQRRGARP